MKRMHEQTARLYEAAREAGVLSGENDQTTLARLLDVAVQNVNNWEARGVSKEGLLEAQHRLGVNATWVVTGKGPMLIDGRDNTVPIGAVVPHVSQSGEPRPGYIRLELLDVEVSAGAGAVADAYPDVLQSIDVLEDWARGALGISSPEHIKLLVVKGDSMAPTIIHGDIVFVDTRRRKFEGDGIYVLDWEGRLLIKRLRLTNDGRMAIQSDNSVPYPPEFVTGDRINQITICGIATAWWALKRY